MKISVETKITIEAQERRIMAWMVHSKVAHELINRRNDEIRIQREILQAFKDSGLIGDKEPEEAPSKGCCVIS